MKSRSPMIIAWVIPTLQSPLIHHQCWIHLLPFLVSTNHLFKWHGPTQIYFICVIFVSIDPCFHFTCPKTILANPFTYQHPYIYILYWDYLLNLPSNFCKFLQGHEDSFNQGLKNRCWLGTAHFGLLQPLLTYTSLPHSTFPHSTCSHKAKCYISGKSTISPHIHSWHRVHNLIQHRLPDFTENKCFTSNYCFSASGNLQKCRLCWNKHAQHILTCKAHWHKA